MVGATATEIVMLVSGNPATGQVLPGRSFGKLCDPFISRWRIRVFHDCTADPPIQDYRLADRSFSHLKNKADRRPIRQTGVFG